MVHRLLEFSKSRGVDPNLITFIPHTSAPSLIQKMLSGRNHALWGYRRSGKTRSPDLKSHQAGRYVFKKEFLGAHPLRLGKELVKEVPKENDAFHGVPPKDLSNLFRMEIQSRKTARLPFETSSQTKQGTCHSIQI
jgi:hypothetical protein